VLSKLSGGGSRVGNPRKKTMNTQKHVFEFTGMVTKKGKDQEPVVYEETFYVVAETSEQALQRVTKDYPKVTGLAYTGKSKACSKYW
jgi:hypothetical protein